MSDNSQQERFDTSDVVSLDDFFLSLCRLVGREEEEEPQLSTDSRKRDKWLHDFIRQEPHLAGVVSSTTSIDTNRGWKVVGGRNQVKRITSMMHNWECAPGLKGWRPSFSVASFSYRCSNMGTVVEMGRDGVGGPLVSLYNVDPTKCRLTGNMDTPLQYYPGKRGSSQKWTNEDFFRVTSMPSEIEEYNGLGYCPEDRAVRLAQLMIAVYRHDEEQLLARAPRGLLLLSGINRNQWDQAMAVRNADLDSDRMKYYGAVAVLASVSAKVDAKLLALSTLPTSFNLRDWMDMTLYGYALCFGYDPSEFWPVQYGALGRGNETEIQHEKATGKGRLDFVLGFQEQFQEYLPDSIEMAFDQRDEQGDLLHAQIANSWATFGKTIYEAGAKNGEGPLLNRSETRVLIADAGVIPSSWSETPDVASTDITEAENEPVVDAGTGANVVAPNPTAASPTGQSLLKQLKEYENDRKISLEMRRRQLLESESVWSAARKFPKEPIVEYEFTPSAMQGKTRIIWDQGSDVLKPRIWNGFRPKIEEEPEPEPEDRTIVVQPNISITMPQQERQKTPDIHVDVHPSPTTINMPEQKAPVANITVESSTVNIPEFPTPIINVTTPEVKVQTDVHIPAQVAPNVTVNVPEQKTPQVTVNVPEQKAPVVNVAAPIIRQADAPQVIVNVPQQPAPVVNITTPDVTVNYEISVPDPGPRTVKIIRDQEGKMEELKVKEN